jgi:hypothetical protein
MSILRLSATVAALLTLPSSLAIAAPSQGRVRLSLETDVLSHEGFKLKSNGTQLSRSETGFGLGGGGLGVGIGAGLGENVLVGGRVLYQTSSESGGGAPSVTTTGFAVSVTPEFILSGDEVRPFLGATIGHRGLSSTSGGVEASTSLTFAGPVVGLHWFPAHSVSIDPSLSLLYEAGGASSAGVDADRSGYAVQLGVSLSAWLGGGDTPREPAVPRSEAPALEPSPPSSPPSESGSVPPRASTAEVRPASPSVRPPAELRSLSVTLPLGGQDRLLFSAALEATAEERVKIVLIASDTLELRACDAFTVVGVSRPLAIGPFSRESLGGGTAPLLALETAAPLSAIRALGSARDRVLLEGCGKTIELVEGSRDALRRLAIVTASAVHDRAAEAERL